jgi:hypothetical protein
MLVLEGERVSPFGIERGCCSTPSDEDTRFFDGARTDIAGPGVESIAGWIWASIYR